MNAQAFGKVILLGEHAVVYGVPALAVGIHRGARAQAEFRDHAPSELMMQGAGIVTDDADSDLGHAFRAALRACNAEKPCRVIVETDLPVAAGLGCSAAMGVAIVRALDALLGNLATPAETTQKAMEWERIFHGNPSGVDATVAAYGGCIFYSRKGSFEPIPLPRTLTLAIGHTGLASRTKTMVEAVARLRERRTSMVDHTFEAIESLVKNARLALEAGDIKALGQLMDLNQMLLSGLFVSTSEIETMCTLARSAGALGVKLTGAGGGGCVVALCSDSPEDVLNAWKAAGFSGFASLVYPSHPSHPSQNPPSPHPDQAQARVIENAIAANNVLHLQESEGDKVPR